MNQGAEIVGRLKIEQPSPVHVSGNQIGILLNKATDQANPSEEIEAFPSPVDAGIASPPVITLLGLSWVRRHSGQLFRDSSFDPLDFKGVEVGELSYPGKGAEGGGVLILHPEIDAVGFLGRFVSIGNDDSRNSAVGQTFHAFARQ